VIPFFDLDRIFLLALLLARASGLVATAPFLGERSVPRKVKILFAVALAFLMLTFAPAVPVPDSLVSLGLLVAAELSVGLVLGFAGRLLLMAFEMAGQVVAIQMGFGMAQVIDPVSGYRSTIVARWLFLGLSGHHVLLRALAGSLDVLPPGRGLLSPGVVEAMTRFTAQSLSTAMSVAAPAIGILLLTSMGLGILARTVPQMNVFIVGFPIKITAGIVAVAFSLPYLLEVARREVGVLVERLAQLVLAA
jgi:flagellar biosynthetic protein FliR